jgi:Protein kinase domain/Repeat of unknown function (DUF5648)
MLTQRLGRGAMGQVYRARVDVPGGEPAADVAVKILMEDLAADPDGLRRFIQEGRLLKSIDHPHVVRIRDVVAEADEVALVMDLVEGGDLRHAVPVPCAEALAARIGAGIAAGLAAVHVAGILHRDLKPENVLVEHRPDGTALARIADFGVARLDATAATRTHGLTGTLGYIAPEVARGGRSLPAGDVYALGAVLYELCTGHLPFRAEHALAVLRAHAEDPAPRPAGMSDPMWGLVSVLLSKNPADRPTAADLAGRLHQLAGFLDPAAVPLSPGLFVAPLPPPAPVASSGPVAPDTVAAGDVAIAGPGSAARPRRARRLLYPIAAAAVAVMAVTGGVWAVFAGSPAAPRAAGAGPMVAPSLTSGPAPASPTAPAVRQPAPTDGGRWPAVRSPSSTVAGTGRPTATGTPAARQKPVASTRTTASADPAAGTVPLYRYVDKATGHHVYVLDASELDAEAGSFTLEGTQGRVFPTRAPGTVPLYRYYEKSTGDHIYTADYGEVGAGNASYTYQRIEAYVFTSAGPGRMPLYRYFNSYAHDHLYTADYGELGKGTANSVLEGISCYVLR